MAWDETHGFSLASEGDEAEQTEAKECRVRHRIARRGIETSQRLGRHRRTVERTMSWLARCRRLHRSYERKADHFLAFTSIVYSLICYRRLT